MEASLLKKTLVIFYWIFFIKSFIEIGIFLDGLYFISVIPILFFIGIMVYTFIEPITLFGTKKNEESFILIFIVTIIFSFFDMGTLKDRYDYSPYQSECYIIDVYSDFQNYEACVCGANRNLDISLPATKHRKPIKLVKRQSDYKVVTNDEDFGYFETAKFYHVYDANIARLKGARIQFKNDKPSYISQPISILGYLIRDFFFFSFVLTFLLMATEAIAQVNKSSKNK